MDENFHVWGLDDEVLLLAQDGEVAFLEVTCQQVGAAFLWEMWDIVEFAVEGHYVSGSENHGCALNIKVAF